MTGEPVIRAARESEALALGELAFRSKAHWGYSPEFMEACIEELSVAEEDIAAPDALFRLAECEGEIAGYYALVRLSQDEYELDALFVEPQWIGRGIGRALIEHAKKSARQLGVRSLLIQGDPNAERFYLAAGAVQVGERESESVPGRMLPEFRIMLVN
jgi:N-acetylglutamate synthase-like GNAT family acetyltransferase